MLEYALNAIAVEIGERGFIEQLRVHHAARGQMINHKVEKFELIRRELAAVQEFSEGSLGRLSVKANERADEARKATVGLQRAERRFVNPGLKENTLKLL